MSYMEEKQQRATHRKKEKLRSCWYVIPPEKARYVIAVGNERKLETVQQAAQRYIWREKRRGKRGSSNIIGSHLRSMGLNVLGYQSD